MCRDLGQSLQRTLQYVGEELGNERQQAGLVAPLLRDIEGFSIEMSWHQVGRISFQ